MTTSANKDGARVIAQTTVKVVGNLQGFKTYSPVKKARAVSLSKKGRLGGETSCTAEADGECKPGCGSEQPRGVLAFTVACCYWWLARVCLCLVGSATENLSRLGRVSFLVHE